MSHFQRLFLVSLLVLGFGIFQTGAWSGIIAQSGDIINLAKWNELANQVLIGLTQSGNTFGTKVILGSNDVQPVAIETANTERVSILSNGRVGVNVTNPANKLEIDSGTGDIAGVRLTQLTSASAFSNGGMRTIGVNGLGDISAVPNGFPTILTTNATQALSNTTYQDVTGLSFPVVVGKRYKFHAYIQYNASTTTRGLYTRMNSPTNIFYNVRVNNALNTSQYGSYVNDITTGLQSTDSRATTGNVAVIDGFITPTTSGTVSIQMRSDLATITLQPNSTLYYYTY